MSAAERVSLQESNVTVGKQQWSEDGRMLGAGVGAGSSYTELGLSAEPAAMSHGVTMGKKPIAAPVAPTAAAPAGAADTTTRSLPPQLAAAPQSPVAATRTGEVTSSSPQYKKGSAGPAADSSNASSNHSKLGTEKTDSNRAATSNVTGAKRKSAATTKPGQVQRVAPANQQQAWYGTAWQWAKRIALGEGKGILELGPPWTKWPGNHMPIFYGLNGADSYEP